MNPIEFVSDLIRCSSYTACLTDGILLALGVIAWRACRHNPSAVTRWLDVGIAAVLGGVVGARLLHVALEWNYFTDHHDEIAKIHLGGLAWHGALLTGIPAALAMAWVRRVPLKAWTDAAALAWPVGLMLAWIGCRRAGCGYGYEVRTLADWPGWLVEELPDVYGLIAPRLEVQVAGALFGGLLLVLALLLTWRDWLYGIRFWLVLALTGLALHLIGYFRADPACTLYNRRVDQAFDLIVLLLCTLTGSVIWLLDRRAELQAEVQTEVKTHESHAGAGPDQAQAG